MAMQLQSSVPFPHSLFDCRGFKSTSKPKTSMKYLATQKETRETLRFPNCIINPEPCKSQLSDIIDSPPNSPINLPFPQLPRPEFSMPQYVPSKPDSPQSSPKSPHSVHPVSLADKERSPFLPPITSSTTLRITDTQFTVFLDYPQTKADSPIHVDHLTSSYHASSCAESDATSQRNIITHSSPTTTPTKPHAGLLMLLNCAQPGISSDPMRPTKRLNDYTGDFKKEFCALLCTNSEARVEWDRFWRKHGCTGKRPCIKAYLAFCELFKEFADLRHNPRYRVLGTRTACRCTRTIHSFQPPSTTRYAPY